MKWLFLILTLVTLETSAQSGRYQLESGNKYLGTVLLSEHRIELDSTIFQVKEVLKDGGRVIYFLEGCYKEVPYKGTAILYNHMERTLGPGRVRHRYSLYIEIRAKEFYYAQTFSIYYDS